MVEWITDNTVWWGKQEYLLACPVCGFDYAHHGDVEVYLREHEDEQTVRLVPGSPDRVVSLFNPSSRRNAIRIAFWGECGHAWYLDIVQHKGRTYLQTMLRSANECPTRVEQ